MHLSAGPPGRQHQGRPLDADHHSPEAGRAPVRHLRVADQLDAPGVGQGLVHRYGVDHGRVGQPGGGDQAGPGPARADRAKVRVCVGLLRADRQRARLAGVHLRVVRRHHAL